MRPLFTRLLSALLVTVALAATPAQANTMVRVHTTQGPIDMTLLDSEAPVTVANFLAYVRGGDYVSDFFHRSAWITPTPPTPFVIQAGGFVWPEGSPISAVPSRGTIVNEYSPTRSNLRATVAMAKVGGDANSATSQWFVNMRDNAANLDNQNGGFTVFARVTPPGMVVSDRISLLPRVSVSSTNFSSSELPVAGWQSGTTVGRNNVVMITEVTEFPATQSVSDRIFNFLEASFPQYAMPSKATTGEALGYQYRYYSGTNVYVGTKDNQVWYLVPALNGDIHSLGSVDDWFALAQAAGY
ncbi:MAG: peptidylprolyl isomerase [Pseudomonadota bacterium]